MAYLGPKPSQTLATSTSQYFNGTGSQTVFTLNRAVNVSEDLEVFVNNIQQEPGVGKSYTASGTTLTFDAAPSSGTANVYVVYRGLAEVTTRLEHDANSALAATTGMFSGNLTLPDNAKAIFGAGSDLQIYHDGSASNIRENGTGNLQIWGDDIHFYNSAGSENIATFITNGAVKLFYDNAQKLATTATGVDVTGTVTADGLTVDGTSRFNNYIHFGGSISTPSTAAAIYRPADNQLAFSTANTERMRIDSTGNVGIGITTPDSEPRLHVRKGDAGGVNSATNSVLTLENNTTAILQFLTPNNASQQIRFGDPQDTGAGFIQYNHSANAIQFGTNGPEKMRLDVNGKLLLNTTSTSYGGQFTARQTAGINVAAIAAINSATSGTRRLIDFFTGTSTTRKGSIESDGTNTSYNTSSDYRLKENVTADWDATTRLKQLNPVRFNFIENADKIVDGFLAHEVQDIVPEAITGTKDGMMDEEYEVTPAVEATYDDEGNVLTEEVPAVMGIRSVPDYQGIDQAKLVPLLVKTIQELEARIAALEAN
jgi:hypothetical protein